MSQESIVSFWCLSTLNLLGYNEAFLRHLEYDREEVHTITLDRLFGSSDYYVSQTQKLYRTLPGLFASGDCDMICADTALVSKSGAIVQQTGVFRIVRDGTNEQVNSFVSIQQVLCKIKQEQFEDVELPAINCLENDFEENFCLPPLEDEDIRALDFSLDDPQEHQEQEIINTTIHSLLAPQSPPPSTVVVASSSFERELQNFKPCSPTKSTPSRSSVPAASKTITKNTNKNHTSLPSSSAKTSRPVGRPRKQQQQQQFPPVANTTTIDPIPLTAGATTVAPSKQPLPATKQNSSNQLMRLKTKKANQTGMFFRFYIPGIRKRNEQVA